MFLDIAKGQSGLYRAHLAVRADGNSAGRWPEDIGFYHAMIGRQRLDNVHARLDTIRQEGVADCARSTGRGRNVDDELARILIRPIVLSRQDVTLPNVGVLLSSTDVIRLATNW